MRLRWARLRLPLVWETVEHSPLAGPTSGHVQTRVHPAILARLRFLSGMWRSQHHCNDAVYTCPPPDHAKTQGSPPHPQLE